MTSKQVELVFGVEKRECPLGICDGSGLVEEGEFDNLHLRTCLCVEELRDNDNDERYD